MARLAAAEAAVAKHAESVAVLARQVDKLQVRTRLVSRDVRGEVKKVSATAAAQGEALFGASARLDKLESDVKDVEGLVEAVQGLAAKQFDLLMTVIGQQKKAKAGAAGKKATTTAMATKAPVKPVTPVKAARSDANGAAKDEWGREVSMKAALRREEGGEGGSNGAAPAVPVAEGAGATAAKQNDDGSVSFSF
jgi:hypothetical protein